MWLKEEHYPVLSPLGGMVTGVGDTEGRITL